MAVVITPKVQRDIAEIIRKHFGGLAAILYGRGVVTDEDWREAIKLGLVDPEDATGHLTGLATYGALLAHLDQAERQSRYGQTLAEFKKEIAKNPVPQTLAEHQAAEHTNQRGAQYVVGLGNKIGAQIGSKLIEADKKLDKKMREQIRDVISARFGDDDAAIRTRDAGLAAGVGEDYFDKQFRSTIKEQVSDIGHLTGDWSRDLQRIVQTESHNAVQEGQTESWLSQEEEAAENEHRAPRQILAFKLPRADACSHCIRLHLDGTYPRIYFLEEIAANGTNVGRKAGEWRIVLGATHPFCACTLHKVPFLLDMPEGWRSGEAAPSVIGPDGRIAP